MSLEQLTTLDAIKQFLDGTQSVAFNVATDKPERYRWVQKTPEGVNLKWTVISKINSFSRSQRLTMLGS